MSEACPWHRWLLLLGVFRWGCGTILDVRQTLTVIRQSQFRTVSYRSNSGISTCCFPRLRLSLSLVSRVGGQEFCWGQLLPS